MEANGRVHDVISLVFQLSLNHLLGCLTCNDPLNGLLKVCQLYVSGKVTGCYQSSLITHVCHISSGKSWSACCQLPGQLFND